MAIKPETVQRLRRIQQSPKYNTLKPETQERLNNLSLQFDEEGKKHFITSADDFFKNPSLESAAKTALLQVPIVGSMLSAPTERNITPFGTAGRILSGFSNVQKDIMERDMKPIEIREPAGPIDKLFTPARAFGAQVADSLGGIGTSFAEGFDAPRGSVKTPLGFQASKERPISDFFSGEDLQGLQEGKGIGILKTTAKAVASDLKGMLNDAAIDMGMNAIIFGTSPALRAIAVNNMHTKIGQAAARGHAMIESIGTTEGVFQKGYKQRFVWEMNKKMNVMIADSVKKSVARLLKKNPFVTSKQMKLSPEFLDFIRQYVPGTPGAETAAGAGATQLLTGPAGPTGTPNVPGFPATPAPTTGAAAPIIGKAPLGAKGPQLPPLDKTSLQKGITEFFQEPPPGAGVGDAFKFGAPPADPGLSKIPPKDPLLDAPLDELKGTLKALQDSKGPSGMIDALKKEIAKLEGDFPVDELPSVDELKDILKTLNEMGAPKEVIARVQKDLAKKMGIPPDVQTTLGKLAGGDPAGLADVFLKSMPDKALEEFLSKELAAPNSPPGLIDAIKKEISRRAGKPIPTSELPVEKPPADVIKNIKNEIARIANAKNIRASQAAEQILAKMNKDLEKSIFSDKQKAMIRGLKEEVVKIKNDLQKKKSPLQEGIDKKDVLKDKIEELSELKQKMKDIEEIELVPSIKEKIIRNARRAGISFEAEVARAKKGLIKKYGADHIKVKKLSELLDRALAKIREKTSPLQKGIDKTAKDRPLTAAEIEKAKEFVIGWSKDLQNDLLKSAKANKRNLSQEIAAFEKDLRAQLAKGDIDAFQANVARRMIIKLDELKERLAKRAGKKIPFPKKSKPKTSIDTNIKGDPQAEISQPSVDKAKQDILDLAKQSKKPVGEVIDAFLKQGEKNLVKLLIDGMPNEVKHARYVMKALEKWKAELAKKDKPFKFADIGKKGPAEAAKIGEDVFLGTNKGAFKAKVVGKDDGSITVKFLEGPNEGKYLTQDFAAFDKNLVNEPAELDQAKIEKDLAKIKEKFKFSDIGEKPPVSKIDQEIQRLREQGVSEKNLEILKKDMEAAAALPPSAPKMSKGDIIRRAKNVLERFKRLPPGENKKALQGIPPRLQEIIDRGAPKEGDLDLINRFLKRVEAEEAALPKKKFKLAPEEKTVPKPSPLEEGIKKPPKKKFSLADIAKEGPVVEGSGKFTVTKNGKPVGNPMPTLAGAEAQAAEFNKRLGGDSFDARELTADEAPKPAPKKAKVAKKTPLEEGIEGPVAKKAPKPAPAALPAKVDPKALAKAKIVKGKKISKALANSVNKYLAAEAKLKKLSIKTPDGKILPKPGRNEALKATGKALNNLVAKVKKEMNIKSDSLAIKIVNKILTYIRDVLTGKKGGLSIEDVGKPKGEPIDISKAFKKFKKGLKTKPRAKRIKKLRLAKEIAFAKSLKPDIQKLVKTAKDLGKSVEEFIKGNPSAFPGAPKSNVGLQNALRRVLQDVPLDIGALAKNDIVQFRPAFTTAGKLPGDVGIVESVGDTIKVRFKNGISVYTPAEAKKFLRESGSVLRLKGLPKKELPDVVANILAKNPKHQTLAEVANAAIDAALKNPNDPIMQAKATQLTQRLINALTDKVIDINDIPSIAKDHGLTSMDVITDLVTSLRNMSTEAGQTLNVLSQLQKKLKGIVTPEQLSQLFPDKDVQLTPNKRFMYRVGNFVNKTANVLKGFLTSQLKTASRNAFMQGLITLAEYANQIAVGVYQKISGTGIRGKEFAGVEAYNEAIKGAVQDVASFAQNLKKLKLGRDKERALLKLLNEFSLDRKNLFGAPIHDVVVNKGIVRVINAANILQETVFRSIFVEAELAKFAKQHGTTIDDIKFFKRHADMVPEMVERALKNTFASNLKQTMFAGDVIKFFKKFPAAGFLLGNPFVKFFLNNLNMIIRRSPLPLTNFFSPEYQRAFQGPNNEEQVRMMGEALQGIIALSIAIGLRSKTFAGPKFYQADLTPWDKEDDAFFDTRPLAPIPQYLFAVELAKNMMGNKEQTTLTGTDIIQGAVSVSRIAGTGLVGLDMLRSEPFKEKESPKQARKNFQRLGLSFIGQILSAPTVPLAQFQDIVGMWDPEENKFKSTQQNPLLGPSINNIPFLKRMLPDLQQVGRATPQQPSGLEAMVEFGTGFRVQRVNKFEQVLAKHGLSSLNPATGDPVMNQRIIGEMNSPAAQKVFTTLIEDPIFKNEKDPKVRKDMLTKWASVAFKAAKESLMAFDDEVGDFLIDKKIDKKMTAANKKLADILMDITLDILGKKKENIFSRERQKLLFPPNK